MLAFLVKLSVFVAHKVNVRSMHFCPNQVLVNIPSAVSDESTPVSHAIKGHNLTECWYELVLDQIRVHFVAMVATRHLKRNLHAFPM
jgi:hypothetical protein